MIKQRKYAAIDIGSNAVRLLISTITEQEGKEPIFKKTSLVRVPIRLGADVFMTQLISEENKKRLIDTMQAFKLLMRSHLIEKYKACATSAMREAKNGQEIADVINDQTGVNIEIIDGQNEASIIAATDLNSFVQSDKTYLYVDVGGGSTEFTLYSGGETVVSKSFKLGTVRLLKNLAEEDVWEEVETWIKEATRDYPKIDLLGSGGNINNIFKSSGKAPGKPLSFLYLSSGSARKTCGLDSYEMKKNSLCLIPQGYLTSTPEIDPGSTGFYCHFDFSIFLNKQFFVILGKKLVS